VKRKSKLKKKSLDISTLHICVNKTNTKTTLTGKMFHGPQYDFELLIMGHPTAVTVLSQQQFPIHTFLFTKSIEMC
jgi:hypothetical protein